MKVCNCCKQEKPIDAYYMRGDGQAGPRSICMVCWRAKYKRPPRKKRSPEEKKKGNQRALKKYRSKASYKAKHAGDQAKRRAHKLKATPTWLTTEQLGAIQAFYDLARCLTDAFGIAVDVDHIVPLKGKNVSGLHVPWNLQIMDRGYNILKSNSHE